MPDSPATKQTLNGQVQLSPRLQAVADLVPTCRVVYDIGTDHGWLPIWLVQRGFCEQAVAADLRTGPLQRASSHIRRYGLSDRIGTRLSDGLVGHVIGADDVVILAGLGGHEIMRIVSAVDKPCPILVIQAMKSLPELRHFLCERGYRIEREILARERHRFYPAMQLRFTGTACLLTDLEAWIGPVILAGRPGDLPDYLVQLQRRLQKQLIGNPQLQSLSDQIAALSDVLINNQGYGKD